MGSWIIRKALRWTIREWHILRWTIRERWSIYKRETLRRRVLKWTVRFKRIRPFIFFSVEVMSIHYFLIVIILAVNKWKINSINDMNFIESKKKKINLRGLRPLRLLGVYVHGMPLRLHLSHLLQSYSVLTITHFFFCFLQKSQARLVPLMAETTIQKKKKLSGLSALISILGFLKK